MTLTSQELSTIMHSRLKNNSCGHIVAECYKAADQVLSFVSPPKDSIVDLPAIEFIFIKPSDSSPVEATRLHPRNINVSVGNILKLLALGAFNSEAAFDKQWLIPFALITLIQELQKDLTIKLDERAAIVLYIISQTIPHGSFFSLGDVFDKSTSIQKDGWSILSKEQWGLELDNLVRLGILYKICEKYQVVETIKIKNVPT